MLNNYSLIIFDWDGTVVDSVPNIVKGLRYSASDLDLPLLTDREYRGVIGMSLEEACNSLYPSTSENQVREFVTAYKSHHHELELNPSISFKGVDAGLDKIKTTGVKLAVATGKRQAGLDRSMLANGYKDDFFDICRTADHAVSKPDPDMLLQILKVMDIPANQALMVGDSVHDMAMARSAGIDRVAVTYGAQQQSEVLQQYDPVLIANHFAGFVDWLGLAAESAYLH